MKRCRQRLCIDSGTFTLATRKREVRCIRYVRPVFEWYSIYYLMHVQSGHYDIHDSKKRKIKKSGKDDQSNHHIYAAQAKGKHKCKIIIHKN